MSKRHLVSFDYTAFILEEVEAIQLVENKVGLDTVSHQIDIYFKSGTKIQVQVANEEDARQAYETIEYTLEQQND